MNYSIVESELHLVVEFDEPFADVSGVVFEPGQPMGERCCAPVTLDDLGPPATLVRAWRSRQPESKVSVLSSRQIKFCCRASNVAADREQLEDLLLTHVPQPALAV